MAWWWNIVGLVALAWVTLGGLVLVMLAEANDPQLDEPEAGE